MKNKVVEDYVDEDGMPSLWYLWKKKTDESQSDGI